MPSLFEIQMWMKEAITGENRQILPFIRTHSEDSPQDRLNVYQEGYHVRLTESLKETFTKTATFFQTNLFIQLCLEFLHNHPSTHPDLLKVGQSFPNFLKTHPSCSSHPYLPDLAYFEWHFTECFLTPEHPPLTPSRLQILLSQSPIHLSLQPYVQLFCSEWNIHTLWKDPSSPPTPYPQHLLLYRSQNQVYVKSILEPQFLILDTLHNTLPLEEALERIPNLSPQDIQTWFSEWVQLGLFCE